jgi:hypothetical protein
VQNELGSNLQSELSAGGAGIQKQLDPLEATAAGSINTNYATIQQRMQQANASRGFGRSGSTVGNSNQLQIARQGDLGNLASQFAAYNLQQQNTVAQQAQQFGFADPGKKETAPGSQVATGLGTLYGDITGNGGNNPIGNLINQIPGVGGTQTSVGPGGGAGISTATIDPADMITGGGD